MVLYKNTYRTGALIANKTNIVTSCYFLSDNSRSIIIPVF